MMHILNHIFTVNKTLNLMFLSFLAKYDLAKIEFDSKWT